MAWRWACTCYWSSCHSSWVPGVPWRVVCLSIFARLLLQGKSVVRNNNTLYIFVRQWPGDCNNRWRSFGTWCKHNGECRREEKRPHRTSARYPLTSLLLLLLAHRCCCYHYSFSLWHTRGPRVIYHAQTPWRCKQVCLVPHQAEQKETNRLWIQPRLWRSLKVERWEWRSQIGAKTAWDNRPRFSTKALASHRAGCVWQVNNYFCFVNK